MMQNRWLGKSLLTLALLILFAGALWHFLNPGAQKPAEAPPPMARSDFKYHYTPPIISDSGNGTESEPARDLAGQPKIPREKVEAWLAKHHRNAASLLAAFHALEDTNYLNEAATNFPNDPQVELAVLARDEFPADRRKWLDLFKASSPSNSLANYLSAQDYFKNGNTDAAVNELLAASGKSQFDNHAMETQLDAEQLYLDSGKSSGEAASFAMSAMAAENLPELATLKRVDQAIADLMQQKLAAGDADSAANLAQMGMMIADKLNSGDSGKYVINQLVGMATEAIVLQHLDQNTPYDFLGGQTPAQVLQANKQQKAALRELVANFQAAYPNLTESELIIYSRRSQIYGEVEAWRWVVQQHPPNNP
ncbi:MAG TPA: hypothetical protein VN836_05170 [Verrucomicrobiae bacterium]|nr:hypothetical protein [Verrucomicrobiae bacterium]